MKAFTYERVNSIEAATRAAAANPDAKYIAGGTNTIDLMKLEIETPTHLIDVKRLVIRVYATCHRRIQEVHLSGVRFGRGADTFAGGR